MTPHEVTNWLLGAIIVIYLLRVLVFWYKASAFKEWIDRGLNEEAFIQTMLVANFFVIVGVSGVLGVFFLIGYLTRTQ